MVEGRTNIYTTARQYGIYVQFRFSINLRVISYLERKLTFDSFGVQFGFTPQKPIVLMLYEYE